MTRWKRQREPRWGPAFAVAVILVTASWLFVPESWIRGWLHRDFSPLPGSLDLPATVDPGPVRLIDPSMLPARPSRPPVQTDRRPVRERLVTAQTATDDDDAAAAEDDGLTWSWDPTSAYTVTESLTRPGPGAAVADSMLRHAEFLRALTLTDLDRALAMLDTTQSALAHGQFRTIDAWIRLHWAGIWRAQGDAARRAAIYERAVGEAERDRGM